MESSPRSILIRPCKISTQSSLLSQSFRLFYPKAFPDVCVPAKTLVQHHEKYSPIMFQGGNVSLTGISGAGMDQNRAGV
ncbi:MAG TPA: hypothetical protein DCP92_11285 [Nitrospiraceae bacterium]|nr:hypothetical protein [Nitrospiraceae bacterium]